jgi:hypothetical protein
MTAPIDPIAVLDSQIAELRASGDTGNVENLLDARDAFAAAIEALKKAHYCGLMIGEDCAWALAKQQREGKYKPTCSDGRPSNADASRDYDCIRRCRETTRAALARFGSQP